MNKLLAIALLLAVIFNSIGLGYTLAKNKYQQNTCIQEKK